MRNKSSLLKIFSTAISENGELQITDILLNIYSDLMVSLEVFGKM